MFYRDELPQFAQAANWRVLKRELIFLLLRRRVPQLQELPPLEQRHLVQRRERPLNHLVFPIVRRANLLNSIIAKAFLTVAVVFAQEQEALPQTALPQTPIVARVLISVEMPALLERTVALVPAAARVETPVLATGMFVTTVLTNASAPISLKPANSCCTKGDYHSTLLFGLGYHHGNFRKTAYRQNF